MLQPPQTFNPESVELPFNFVKSAGHSFTRGAKLTVASRGAFSYLNEFSIIMSLGIFFVVFYLLLAFRPDNRQKARISPDMLLSCFWTSNEDHTISFTTKHVFWKIVQTPDCI